MARKRRSRDDVYIPSWTDPTWQDQGPSRDASDWKVKDPIMDMVRPAMLDGDQAKNPTEYAKRFGIFPGRTDGRSCTSPTRSSTRLVPLDQPPGPTPHTGKDLANKFESVARNEGMELDDLMTNSSNQTRDVLGNSYDYLQLFEELMIEEFWQGCLFGDMTMDELLSGDHFSMGNFECNLSGPLNSLLKRKRWDPDPFAEREKGPQNLYNLDGQSFELNARTNDKVWDAIQPALQVASRMLDQNEDFFLALADVTNWYEIPDTIDKRDIQDVPKFKFEIRSDKSEAVGYKSGKRPSAGFKPKRYTRKVVKERLALRLVSAHYNMSQERSKPFEEEGPAGRTDFNRTVSDDDPIEVNVASELVWQLLTDKLSSSEKMMTSFILAVVIVHELMHAYRLAIDVWVGNPRRYGITDPVDIKFCRAIREDIDDLAMSSDSEPYYKDDPMAEVGHAYEAHVLGSGTWPMSGPYVRAQPVFLRWFGGISTRFHWAHGYKNILPNLPVPQIFSERIVSYNQHGNIGKVFRQDFWDSAVKKYGMVALRNPPDNPSRTYFSYEETVGFKKAFRKLDFGTESDRAWLIEFYKGLMRSGQRILAQYVLALVHDAVRLESIARRFVRIGEVWEHKEAKLREALFNVMMVEQEALTFFGYKDRGRSNEIKRRFAEMHHRIWNTLAKSNKYLADNFSESLRGTLDHFIITITQGNDLYEQRLTSALMQLAYLLDEERQIHESMVCELYDLPAAYWELYQQAIPGHQTIWVARVERLIYHLGYMLSQLQDINGLSSPWKNEWDTKLSGWVGAFRNIEKLISGDSSAAHQNWRDMLVTIPMLRKSRRRPWERWFFLAKKASLNLTGTQLEEMTEFRNRFEKILNLSKYKIVLPSDDPNEQGLAEKWAGLLDNMTGYERDETRLMEAIGEINGRAFAKRLMRDCRREKRKTDKRIHALVHGSSRLSPGWQNQLDEAKKYLDEKRRKKEEEEKKKKNAQSQNVAAQPGQAASPSPTSQNDSGSSPQITRPTISGHPVPLSGSPNSTSRKRKWSSTSPDDPLELWRSQRSRSATRSTKFEALDELMSDFGEDTDNTFAPAGRAPRPVPREYEISGDIIDQLADAVAMDVEMMDIDEPPNEAVDKLQEDMERDREAHLKALEELERWQEIAHEAAEEEKRLAEWKRRNPDPEPQDDDDSEDESLRKRARFCGTLDSIKSD